MTQATDELKSDEVRVQVHRKSACRIEMHVKTVPQIVKEARKNAIRSVKKEISFPGFRKGHAPDEMVLKEFPSDVEREMHKAIADLAFVAAQKIVKVPLLNNHSPISFDLKNQSMEEGAELVFSFETEPTVPNIDPLDFAVHPVKRAEVAEKQIDEAIRQMRFFYAHWKPIQERPIQEGDTIMIDLDIVEGEQVQKVFHHIRFEVSKERMADWMKKLVQGAKAGDVLEGLSEPDETATDEEKREFKPKKVKLTILKVEEALLPELNDDFAKKVGANDIPHMRQSIADLLNKQADEKVQTELREQVNRYLFERYPFELPQSLVETEKKHRFGQLMQNPKFKANWNQMSQEERKNLEEKLREEASRAVRLFYLSRQIVQNANIPVTHQEVQNEAISIRQSHGERNAEIDKMPKEIYALALSKVILIKAQDYLLDKKT